MKKLLLSAVVAGSLFGYGLNVVEGWQLSGAVEDINVSSFDNSDVDAVWSYNENTKKWKAYFPTKNIDLSKYDIEHLNTIKKGEGFWIFSLKDSIIQFQNNIENNNSYTDGGQSNDGYNHDYAENNVTFFDSIKDGVSDFTLDDVANKTFKVQDEDKLEDVTFDSNGKAVLTFPYATYDIWYDNGSVFAKNREYNNTIQFKKLAANSDGMIIAGIHQGHEKYGFLDYWMEGDYKPVDMNTVLPYKMYSSYSPDYRVFEENGSIEYYHFDSSKNTYVKDEYEDKFTIDNGKVVISYEGNWTWNYLDNNITTYYKDVESYQIVQKVERYDVILDEDNWSEYYVDSNLVDKTWNDIVGKDIVIDGNLILENNGSVSYYDYTDANNTIVKNNYDSNERYVINGNTLTISYKGSDYNRTYTLDSQTGKVTLKDSYKWIDITSSSPIIDEEIFGRNNYKKLNRKIKSTNLYKEFLSKKHMKWSR